MLPEKSKSKSSNSNCYSITIRTGKGINLGSNPFLALKTYIETHFTSYIFTLEKTGSEEHFQGGLFNVTQIRQDHLRNQFLSFAIELYKDSIGDQSITTKGLENVKKYSTKVVAHNDWEILQKYCLKDEYYTIFTKSTDINLQNILPEKYCQHEKSGYYITDCNTCIKNSYNLTIDQPISPGNLYTYKKTIGTIEYS